MTSMRRNDVASTSFRRHVPARFFINQCQIITFLILKSDIVENSRIELRGIVLPVVSTFKSNYSCIYYYFTLQLGTFVILRKRWVDYWGGGPKGMLPPPLKLFGGPAPLAPPSSYAYDITSHYVIKPLL